MAAEDVAQALMAMDDPEVRRRVGNGDFSTLELSLEEQALVQGATAVLPDGHPDKVLVSFEPGEVELHSHRPGEDSGYWPAETAKAIEYVQSELDDPRAQASFSSWLQTSADRFP